MDPNGFRKMMGWLRDEYGSDLDIYITENGFGDYMANLDDIQRLYYHKHYLNDLLKGG